jgi:hypothetical protein
VAGLLACKVGTKQGSNQWYLVEDVRAIIQGHIDWLLHVPWPTVPGRVRRDTHIYFTTKQTWQAGVHGDTACTIMTKKRLHWHIVSLYAWAGRRILSRWLPWQQQVENCKGS